MLLGSLSGRRMLSTVRTVIVDEIHALAGNKRGCHLALSLERLEALCDRPLTRIGLSATQKPIAEVARFLVGARRTVDGAADCRIVDIGYAKRRDLALETPPTPLAAVMSNAQWDQVYARVVELVAAHRTTLVFVNTLGAWPSVRPSTSATCSARRRSPRTTAAWPRRPASTPSSGSSAAS